MCQKTTELRCRNQEWNVHETETRLHVTIIILKLSKIHWSIQEPSTPQVNVRCIVPERIMHRFTKGDVNPIQFYDIMQLRTMKNMIVNFRRRERHTLLST
jgi:hypothetical protein